MAEPVGLTLLDTARRPAIVRDTSRPVLLVGFQHQGNLGLGYLASTLREHGYTVAICDIEAPVAEIVATAERLQPMIVGFSLIFQFYIRQYGEIVRRLRAAGIMGHFTMGGHFPSLSHVETLRMVPEIDSVTRFEGEMTLLELADVIGRGEDWRGVAGIAFRGDDGEVKTTGMRALVDDLDTLPYPDRNFEPEKALGHKALPLVASRGCARTCSFCSIQTFYRTAPGKIVRTRKPSRVVEEMRSLYEERGIRIFLFQDDDFPLYGPVWRRWAMEFVNELHRTGLARKVIWKMNCRADSVDVEMFRRMRDAGLYLVYMGLESGNEEGLKTLHKQVTVEQNLRAVALLKQADLLFEFGFMLFDPGSTLESVQQNVNFLRTILADGCAAAVFCRMLPYDGTPIKDELERTGRLKGDVCKPEYDFLEPRVNALYRALSSLVDVWGWIHGFEALSPQLNWVSNEIAIMERMCPGLEGMFEYKQTVRGITQASNAILFEVMGQLLEAARRADPAAERLPEGATSWTTEKLKERKQEFLEILLTQRNAFVGRHQAALLDSLRILPLEPTLKEATMAMGAGTIA
jgi:anaerobic magnesium-protoporphyrin IX monomethyl ester cyclase